jgi:hypothetical protein
MAGMLWATPQSQIEVNPKYSNTCYAHVTLQYNVELEDYRDWVGQTIVVRAFAHAWNEEAQAIRVHVPCEIPCKDFPHLTLSWSIGSAPVRSLVMLQEEHDLEPMDLEIPCIIEWVEFKK